MVKNRNRPSYLFLRIQVQLASLDKKTRTYGTGHVLHVSEIHMIKAVRENPGMHVTGLAEMLGVTKGAVSQILQKLEKKGMIEKIPDPANASRLILKTTPDGDVAYDEHERLHAYYDLIFTDLLQNATEENKIFLTEFLISLNKQLELEEKKIPGEKTG